MAFRGIDMQIMVTKAQELSGDRARADRQHDVLAGQAALRGRERIEQEQQRTGKAARIEDTKIREDAQGHSGAGYTPDGSHKREEDVPAAPGHELLDLPVESSEKPSERSYTFDATV